METEIKVYVVLYTVKTRDLVGDRIEADPKVLGVFRQRVDAQDYVDQYLDDKHNWEQYEILERELI